MGNNQAKPNITKNEHKDLKYKENEKTIKEENYAKNKENEKKHENMKENLGIKIQKIKDEKESTKNFDKPSSPESKLKRNNALTNNKNQRLSKENSEEFSISRKSSSAAGSLWMDIRKVYKFQDVLGGGTFGTVRIAYKRDNPEMKYAVKSFSKKSLNENDLSDLEQEVEILSTLYHPNIIRFYETYEDAFYFHIVMELCTGKEIFDRIIELGRLNEQIVAKIIYKILKAVYYCHNNNITHRDIKPENILFESKEEDAEIKLIDFGLSKKFYANEEKMSTIVGSPFYVAPEVLKGSYDKKCDIWSIGAITYVMLCGEPPFNANNNNEIFMKIINEEVDFSKESFAKVSAEAIDFMKKCLCKNVNERLSASEAVEHPWFKEILKEIHKNEKLCPEILENLKNFSIPQKFKKIVLHFFVNFSSVNDLKKLKDVFQAMDSNHEGKITVDELKNAFSSLNLDISDEEVEKIFSLAEEKNGKIDYKEFLLASMDQKKFLTKERLIQAFNYFDVDNSGFICAEDIKNALLRFGKKILDEDELNHMIQEVNPQKKKISLEEFLNMFNFSL